MMNNNQRYVIIGGVCAIIATALVPPFFIEVPHLPKTNLGFSFILDPPTYRDFHGNVDLPLLLVEWTGILIVCAALWFLLKDSNQGGRSDTETDLTESIPDPWLSDPKPKPEGESTESSNPPAHRRFTITSTTGLTPDEVMKRRKKEREAQQQ